MMGSWIVGYRSGKPVYRVPAIYVYETTAARSTAGEGRDGRRPNRPSPALAPPPEDIGIIPAFLDRSVRA